MESINNQIRSRPEAALCKQTADNPTQMQNNWRNSTHSTDVQHHCTQVPVEGTDFIAMVHGNYEINGLPVVHDLVVNKIEEMLKTTRFVCLPAVREGVISFSCLSLWCASSTALSILICCCLLRLLLLPSLLLPPPPLDKLLMYARINASGLHTTHQMSPAVQSSTTQVALPDYSVFTSQVSYL